MKNIRLDVPLLLKTFATILVILLIAGSIEHLELLPGEKTARFSTTTSIISDDSINPERGFESRKMPLWILFLFLLPLVPIMWKMVVKMKWEPIRDIDWIPVLLLFFAITLAGSVVALIISFESAQPSSIVPNDDFVNETSDFTAHVSSVLWVWFATTFALLTVLIRHTFKRRSNGCNQTDNNRIRNKVNNQLRQAVEKLKSGQPPENTIIQCYMTLCDLLASHHGISREESMTPREFEEKLGLLGWEIDAISDLTRLFEQARYGELGGLSIQAFKAVTLLENVTKQIPVTST